MQTLISIQQWLYQSMGQGLGDVAGGHAPAIVLALVAAIAFGALHAMMPGHGKTVLVSYHLGQDARPLDSFLNGAILALTHVGLAVLLVLAGFAVISKAFAYGGRTPQFELASGVLIGAVYAVAGVGIGELARNPALAVGVVLGWAFVIEGVLPVVLREPQLDRWLPTNATRSALLLGRSTDEAMLHPLAGVSIVVGLVAALLWAGLLRAARTDPMFGNIFDHFAVEYEYANGARVLSMCRQTAKAAENISERVVGARGFSYTDSADGYIKGAKPYENEQASPNPYVQEHVDLVASIKAGKPLNRNPLKDLRVRRAMSKAINRQALVERVMEGAAVATGQLMPAGFFGFAPALKPEPYDPDGARKLLAEAGYPDGFGLTLHAPNNRYVNDEQIAQAGVSALA